MKRHPIAWCLIPALVAVTQMARAEDGGQLHDANCVSCHKSEVYTRADRKVHTSAELDAQVMRCESALELMWFEAQRKAVADYLNSTYYHFDKDKS
jgi:mono/diheme cytochrome c family protein